MTRLKLKMIILGEMIWLKLWSSAATEYTQPKVK